MVRHYRSGSRSFETISLTYLLYRELCLLTASGSGIMRLGSGATLCDVAHDHAIAELVVKHMLISLRALLPRQPRSDLLIFRANQFSNLTIGLEHLPVPCSPAEPLT